MMLFGLTGCYEEISLTPDARQKLCMYAVAEKDSTVKVLVALTYVWGAKNDTLKYPNSAEVKLYVNDRYIESLSYNKENSRPQWSYIAYDSNYKTQSNDKVKIVVEHPDYESIQGETIIPADAQFEVADIKITSFKVYPSHPKNHNPGVQLDNPYDDTATWLDATLDIEIQVKDKIASPSYYKLSYATCYSNPKAFMSQYCNYVNSKMYCNDAIFKEYLGKTDVVFYENSFGAKQYPDVFCNTSFRGETKIINIQGAYNLFGIPKEYESSPYIYIDLYSITKAEFESEIASWNSSKSIKSDLSEVGLSDYVWRVSNVSNRCGLVVGRSLCRKQIDINKYFQNYITDHSVYK